MMVQCKPSIDITHLNSAFDEIYSEIIIKNVKAFKMARMFIFMWIVFQKQIVLPIFRRQHKFCKEKENGTGTATNC